MPIKMNCIIKKNYRDQSKLLIRIALWGKERNKKVSITSAHHPE